MRFTNDEIILAELNECVFQTVSPQEFQSIIKGIIKKFDYIDLNSYYKIIQEAKNRKILQIDGCKGIQVRHYDFIKNNQSSLHIVQTDSHFTNKYDRFVQFYNPFVSL